MTDGVTCFCSRFSEENSKRTSERMRDFVWEQKYAKFEEHVGMPKITSTLHLWKQTQDAKEIEENEGGTVWSGRKGLKRCIAQKNASKSAGKTLD